MDKNIAAILRNDARTVHVRFDQNGKLYTYVTHLAIKEGDFVIVQVECHLKVVEVIKVDEELEIDPNSDIKYHWIVDRVDLESHQENEAKNAKISKTLGKAYQANLRRSFADTVMASLPDGKREEIALLLS